jgi:hypothetical protein
MKSLGFEVINIYFQKRKTCLLCDCIFKIYNRRNDFLVQKAKK